MVKRAGAVLLSVQLLEPDGTVIQQRPFSPTCVPGEPAPQHFQLLWTPRPLVAGEAAAIEVVCKDGFGNLLEALPPWELWSVFLQQAGSQVGTVDIQPLAKSRYGFTATCPTAGATQLAFAFAGVPLFGGPVDLTVTPGPIDVRASSAEFVGGASGAAFTAGRPFSVKLTLCDALHNAVAPDGNADVKARSPPSCRVWSRAQPSACITNTMFFRCASPSLITASWPWWARCHGKAPRSA